MEQLVNAYGQVCIGDPLADGTLMGPLIDAGSVTRYEQTILRAQELGGQVLCGGQNK